MAEKEYIDRGAFDRDLQNLVKEYNRNCESDKSSGAFEALYRLRLAPAADVAPVVHGKWRTTNAYPHWLWCSECHKKFIPNMEWIERYDIPTNYCPHCGAKMKGE